MAVNVAAWVKYPTSSNDKAVYGSYSAGAWDGRRISLRSNAFTISCNAGSFGELAAQGPIPGGQWVHLAGTWDGTTMRVYWDGVEKSSASYSCTLPSATVNQIGSHNGRWYFDGIIDEVQVYSRAFSVAEVLALARAYREDFVYNQIGNITSKDGVAYTYGTKPHAVTAVGSTSYGYDSNGSMTTRGAQTLTWDTENRVTAVTGGASFAYDGDGARVKRTESGETVVYVNRFYEKNVTTGVVTTYYYFGGQLVALRKGSTLEYVHQDHVGSSSVQ